MRKFFTVPFAKSGTKITVPDAHAVDNTVNYTDGYGPDYALPLDDPDALQIEREKMNALFYDFTYAIAELQGQGIPDFITAAQNGGNGYIYARGAMVRYTDENIYFSKVDNNIDLPSASNKWVMFDPSTFVSSVNGKNGSVTLSSPDVGAVATSAVTNDPLLAANSASLIPTEQAVKAYVDAGVSANASSIATHTTQIAALQANQQTANQKLASVGFSLSPKNGTALQVGDTVTYQVTKAFTIAKSETLIFAAGTITIDIQRVSLANFPSAPTTIIGGGGTKPTVTSGQKATDATLTNWTTSIAQDDIITAIVTAVTGTIPQAILKLTGNAT